MYIPSRLYVFSIANLLCSTSMLRISSSGRFFKQEPITGIAIFSIFIPIPSARFITANRFLILSEKHSAVIVLSSNSIQAILLKPTFSTSNSLDIQTPSDLFKSKAASSCISFIDIPYFSMKLFSNAFCVDPSWYLYDARTNRSIG